MNWLMSYGAKVFAVLTLLAAAWQVFGGSKPTTMQWIVLVLAALTTLTLFLPQLKVDTTISTGTPPSKK